jgi:hypothetical protein
MPFNSARINFIEIFNEVTFLSLTYFSFCFTDFIIDRVDKRMETWMGYIYMGILLSNFAVNILIVIVEII